MIAIASPKPELGSRAESRTKEIERCLKMNPDYIFMMDDDQTIPDYGLDLLQRWMIDPQGINYDITVIDTPNKGYEDSNVRYHPDGTIAYSTIACCLIKPSVFSRIKRPWFSTEYEYRETGQRNGKLTWEVQKKYQDDNRGEDVYFTRKCLETGLKINVVATIKCKHFDLEAL